VRSHSPHAWLVVYAPVGCVGGGGFEYIRSAKESEATLRNRRMRDAYDVCYICTVVPWVLILFLDRVVKSR